MTPCRCGHGRHTHRRGRGKLRLPCQAFVPKRLPNGALVWGAHAAVCKCRDYHPVAAYRLVKVLP